MPKSLRTFLDDMRRTYPSEVVSKKMSEGDAGRAAAAALTWDWAKNVFVFDEDIDVYNPTEILWALATRVQPHSQICIIRDIMRGSLIDPSMDHPRRTSVMIVDATDKPEDILVIVAGGDGSQSQYIHVWGQSTPEGGSTRSVTKLIRGLRVPIVQNVPVVPIVSTQAVSCRFVRRSLSSAVRLQAIVISM